MDLQKFITETLVSITSGVEDANKISNRFELSGQVHARGTSGQSVEFDVGIEVGKTKDKGVDGGIKVAAIGVGGTSKGSETYQQIHRLRFKVFVTEK